ncbi:hypothetical protein H4R34_004489 [Dimargaris verticillata]|uniref:Transcription elongation factor 1 homolog n=1 Tax=Dimargaris verticillata TaxID=2761393 RepID=A0A9W8B4T5_9FUNG|nr:hypothetical protein H4R34_004489 [Dimargaris verticillata]
MGKRKSARKPVKKEKVRLDKVFDCLFCNHEKSIVVKLDREHKIGHINCRVCPAAYQAPINYLSDPIDVYSDWIDACEDVNKEKPAARNRAGLGAAAIPGRRVDALGVPDALDDDDEEF